MHNSPEARACLTLAAFVQRYAADDSTIVRLARAASLRSIRPNGKALFAHSHGACGRSARRCWRSCCSRPISASARSPMICISAWPGRCLRTLLVWAGPAQIILISTLGSGATIVQAAIAVTVSAIRLFPMVVSVLPMMRTPRDQAAASDPGGAFHRGNTVGRVLSLSAASAARTPDRLRPRARQLACVCVSLTRDHDRLLPGGQSVADCLQPQSCC